MERIIYGFNNPPPTKVEILDPENKTEKKGYVPIRNRIESLVLAGYRLQGFRDGMYDGHEDIDPFRRPGLDFAEIVELSRKAGEKVAEYRKKHAENLAKQAEVGSTPTPASTPSSDGQK